MCTLIAAFRHYPGWPLVVAANRDERLDRPASGPGIWPGERFLAPRDELAGGSWLGLSASGLFVGITNRFGAGRDDGRESRGQLVVEALRAPSARELHRRLAFLPPERFNAFHLLYADSSAACVTWSDGSRILQEELSPGVHLVTERSLGGDDRARTERIRAGLAAVPPGLPSPESLMSLLRQHAGEDPLGSVCVHVPALGYGTRSSMVLYLPDRLAEGRLFWAEGPPCTASFEDSSELLRELRAGSGFPCPTPVPDEAPSWHNPSVQSGSALVWLAGLALAGGACRQPMSPPPPADARETARRGLVLEGTVRAAGEEAGPGKKFRGAWLEREGGEQWVISYRADSPFRELGGKRVKVEGETYTPEGQALAGTHFRVRTMELLGVDPSAPLVRIGPEERLRGRFEEMTWEEGTKLAGEKTPVFIAEGGKSYFLVRLPEKAPPLGSAVTVLCHEVEPSPFASRPGGPHLWILGVVER
ncbi:MAG: NRDE family protein [Myxococcales bacterium]|nr:NRDE family protein [Myxococcales bacterium]